MQKWNDVNKHFDKYTVPDNYAKVSSLNPSRVQFTKYPYMPYDTLNII